jgi:hypothetical protein
MAEYDTISVMPENADMLEVVYHYTTMGTMMKIAETASIWATSINYLNDVSEGDYFRELVRKRIPEYRAWERRLQVSFEELARPALIQHETHVDPSPWGTAVAVSLPRLLIGLGS